MPFDIVLEGIPAGYLASVSENQEANVIVREFISSEDGDLFISRLEGFPLRLVAMLPRSAEISPGMIHHMLAVIRRDKTATVYVNELKLIAKIRFIGGRDLKVGEPIFQDDVLDIEELSLEDAEIPKDAGIVFVFSAGWRKGLFYDLLPLSESGLSRDYDLEVTLGRYLAYLSYQHLFKLTETDWDTLFAQQWFPFASLKTAIRKRMIEYVKNRANVDGLLTLIAADVKATVGTMLDRWRNDAHFAPNFPLIERAVNRYLAEDYISATSILYPQIEGVMRKVYYANNPPERVKSKRLATFVVQSRHEGYDQYSLLLPLRFITYLERVYFAGFGPDRPATMSRHTVAHGVADPKDYSLKAATIGLLILDQIFYFMPVEEEASNKHE